jgi:hypothetical protein
LTAKKTARRSRNQIVHSPPLGPKIEDEDDEDEKEKILAEMSEIEI